MIRSQARKLGAFIENVNLGFCYEDESSGPQAIYGLRLRGKKCEVVCYPFDEEDVGCKTQSLVDENGDLVEGDEVPAGLGPARLGSPLLNRIVEATLSRTRRLDKKSIAMLAGLCRTYEGLH